MLYLSIVQQVYFQGLFDKFRVGVALFDYWSKGQTLWSFMLFCRFLSGKISNDFCLWQRVYSRIIDMLSRTLTGVVYNLPSYSNILSSMPISTQFFKYSLNQFYYLADSLILLMSSILTHAHYTFVWILCFWTFKNLYSTCSYLMLF